jgi:hypothetical protein
MYREIRAAAGTMDAIQAHLRRAILAEDTREIGTEASAAQALTIEMLDRLKAASANAGDRPDANPALVDAAMSTLNMAWQNGERVAIGSNVTEFRAAVIDFKTCVDYARAYLRAAIGSEEV